jgi:hypothetical protein
MLFTLKKYIGGHDASPSTAAYASLRWGWRWCGLVAFRKVAKRLLPSAGWFCCC